MFEFVSVGASGRALPADRSRIRSKAALEKNKRADSRRSRREAKRLALLEKEAASRVRPPSPPPHDLQLVPFAEKIDIESQELLHKVFSLKTIQQGKPPLERCIDFTLWDAACFEWLQQDKAFLQSVLASAAMVDASHTLSRPKHGNRMWYHLHRTITILNRKLSEEDNYLMDSTLNVVLTLCITACALGDRVSLRAHLMGLQQIVKLRGGLDFLRKRPMLHFRINHIDLTWALMSGEQPFFLYAFTSWKPLFPQTSLTSNTNTKTSATKFIMDKRLIDIFQDMQHAVWLLNESVKKGVKYSGEAFQPILDSIQSRLLSLEDQIDDAFSECIRLAMLAFHFWAMNFPSIQFRATYLESRLETNWRSLDEEYNSDERFALQLWISVVAAGSLSGFRSDWMTNRFNTTVRELVPTWNEANKRLKEVMWIESIHDEPGRSTFERLFQST